MSCISVKVHMHICGCLIVLQENWLSMRKDAKIKWLCKKGRLGWDRTQRGFETSHLKELVTYYVPPANGKRLFELLCLTIVQMQLWKHALSLFV